MKKIIAMVLVLLLLAGCTAGAGETSAPPETTLPAETSAPETMVPDTTAPGTEPATEPSEPSMFADYTYRHTDARDKAWEEDIVYLTKVLLGENVTKGHPYLQDKDFSIYTLKNGYQAITTGNFYNKTLRDEFIAAMDQLIDAIPSLTDNQITFEMQANLALLKDLHTSIVVDSDSVLPVFFEVLWDENGPGLYAVRVPEAYGEGLWLRLDSINGVSVEEILQNLSGYISAENEYAAAWQIGSIWSASYISYPCVLAAIGVMELDDASAEYVLEREDGSFLTMEIPVISWSEYQNYFMYAGDFLFYETLMYTDFGTDNYWYQVLEEDGLLYIRFNRFDREEDCWYPEFVRQIDELLRNSEGITKIAVDVRGNGGGIAFEYADELIGSFESAEMENVYVLIDAGTYSASINLASYFRMNMESVQIVGTPGGQPANFWGGVQGFELPNSGLYFQRPSTFCMNIPADDSDALMPDIIVYQTIEDYRNQIDTVLEAVKDFD